MSFKFDEESLSRLYDADVEKLYDVIGDFLETRDINSLIRYLKTLYYSLLSIGTEKSNKLANYLNKIIYDSELVRDIHDTEQCNNECMADWVELIFPLLQDAQRDGLFTEELVYVPKHEYEVKMSPYKYQVLKTLEKHNGEKVREILKAEGLIKDKGTKRRNVIIWLSKLYKLAEMGMVYIFLKPSPRVFVSKKAEKADELYKREMEKVNEELKAIDEKMKKARRRYRRKRRNNFR